MTRQLEQFADAIEHIGPHATVRDGQFIVTAAPGVRFRCPAMPVQIKRLADKLRRARMPKRDRRPVKGALTDTEIEERAARYARFMIDRHTTTVTLWPANGSNRGYQTKIECALLERLTGVPTKPTPRPSPDRRRALVRRAKQQGYTIRYADPEGVNPPCTY